VAASALELWQIKAHGLPVYFPVPLFFLSWNATVYAGKSTNEKRRNFISQVLGKRYQEAPNKIKPGSHNSRTVSLYGPQLNSNTLTVEWFLTRLISFQR
jgi:hypothetical protein